MRIIPAYSDSALRENLFVLARLALLRDKLRNVGTCFSVNVILEGDRLFLSPSCPSYFHFAAWQWVLTLLLGYRNTVKLYQCLANRIP